METIPPTNDFINMMFSSHFMPSVLHPTRITDNSSTLIDNIFLSNIIDCCIVSGNLLSIISDHLPQFSVLKDKAPEYRNASYFGYDYRRFDKTKFLSDYSDIEKSYLNDKSWLDCNKLALNIDKTNFVLFHSPRKKLPDHINVKFGKKMFQGQNM